MPFCENLMSVIIMCLFMTTLGLKKGMSLGKHRAKRFTQTDVCYETSKSLNMVDQCPTNATIFKERSEKKTCNLYPSCSGIPLVYHCVSYKDGLAEVCAPRDQITGFCCALYDEGVGRVVEDYNRPCTNCSFRYPSDNIVKYPQCIVPPKTTFSDSDTKGHTPCHKEKGRGKRMAECNSDVNENAGELDEIGLPVEGYLYIIAPAVIFVICFTTVIIYWKRKKKYSTGEKESEDIDDAESKHETILLYDN